MVEHEKLKYGVIVEENKKFNVRLNNNELLCEEWFDTYKLDDKEERLVFGYRNDDEKNLYGYIFGATDKFGKIILKQNYDMILFNEEDVYTVYKGEKSGYIDSRLGSEITPIIFSYAGRFKDGKAYVEYNHMSGYISRNEWKLATADGIKYNFNLLKWIDENKELIEKEKMKKISL